MAFLQDDIYTGSGSVMLHNAWTPYVSKFDSSAFYNWEQDNLPLYDLEERTYELWEQAGFPTSAVPGLSLVVSADTPRQTLAQNSTIFTDLSSCIAAIPKVVRFPVFIEVCNFGDIGKLELHNFRIEEAGSIEIINRAYSKVYTASATTQALDATPTYNQWGALTEEINTGDLSATLFSGITQAVCTSSLTLSTRVLSGINDVRVSAVNSFLYPQHDTRKAPLTVALKRSDMFTGATGASVGNAYFQLEPWENVNNISLDNTLDNLDVSAKNQFDDGKLIRSVPVATTTKIGGSIYLNSLYHLSVKNCNGPIYVRNFCVNGEAKTGNVGIPVGIEVTNSDVLLENCAATRCRDAGFKFNNSKVTLSRSAFSYRNYDIGPGVRERVAKTGIGFHAVDSDLTISALISGTAAQEATNGTGVAGDWEATGQDVIVAASRNYVGIQLDNSRLTGGFERQVATDETTGGITTCELNTGYGLLLNNSQINIKGLLDIYGNTRGVEAHNSKVTYQNLCVEGHRNQGVIANKSSFLFDSTTTPGAAGQTNRQQLDFSSNSQHLDIHDQSEFTFVGKDNIPTSYGNTYFTSAHGVIRWGTWDGGAAGSVPQSNLPAINVENNSTADFLQARLLTRNPTQTVANSVDYGLAARAFNNSKVAFYGTSAGCSFVWGPDGYTKQKNAAGLYAGQNSEVNLHGPTLVAQFGVDALAEDNSVINIQPQRSRTAYGVEASAFGLEGQANHTSVELHSTRACLVANKNSVINLEDLGDYHRHWIGGTAGNVMLAAGTDYPTQTYDISSLMQYGSLQFYPNPQNAQIIAASSFDNIIAANAGVAGCLTTIPDRPVFTGATNMNTILVNDSPVSGTTVAATRGLISGGGVCVRVAADSEVNVTNVHFPTGNNGGVMDGVYYDGSGTTCDQLMIWNIADTSRLNASYCSVSGSYPSMVGEYHGPSALWVSAQNTADETVNPWPINNYTPASGAPSGTPDTGVLSVLDTFGAGSGVWVVPSGVTINQRMRHFYPVSAAGGVGGVSMNNETTSALMAAGINVSSNIVRNYGSSGGTGSTRNTGPFRIYWSVNPAAKLLQTDMSGFWKGKWPHTGDYSGVVGLANQIFAQGYNLSAPVSAVLFSDGVSVSGDYPQLLRFNTLDNPATGLPGDGWDNLHTSGFYYCEDFVDDNPTQCMMDESAADTFQNAKNATLGSSGRPRKVTVYRARADGTSVDGTIPGTNRGSEAYQGDGQVTLGYKSSNIFDLRRDN